MKPRTLLALVAAGAAIALLANTKKGKEVTADLLDCAKDTGDNLNKFTAKAGDQLSDLSDYISREAMSFGEEARRRILNILDETMNRVKSSKFSQN
jgi:gas vesicle protein